MNATTKSLLKLLALRQGARLLLTLSALMALVAGFAAPAHAQTPAKARPEAQAQPAVAKAPAAAPAAAAPSNTTSAASSAAAHSAVASGPASATEQESSAASGSSDKGMNTGVKVHGHWTIDVRNPDGTLVTHREFENSLQPGGQNFLATILSREQSVGDWRIILDSNSTAQICTNPSGGLSPCEIDETGSASVILCQSGSLNQCFTGLQVSQPPLDSGLTFSLQGQVTAGASGTVDNVQTSLRTCSASVTAATCVATQADTGSTGQFSAAPLPALNSGLCGGANQPSCAIPVGPHQIVQVTVTYSFQ